MATSGSFNTDSANSFYMSFEWTRTGYDSVRNEHYIHYVIKTHNTPGYYRTVYERNLSINNNLIYSDDEDVQMYDDEVLQEGNFTVASSNSAGDGSFSAYLEAGIGISSGVNISGSDSWNLDRIPRYAEISEAKVQSTGLTTAIIKYAVSRTANIYCKVDDGAYGSPRVQNTTSGTFTITGLSPNVNHKFKILARAVDSGLDRESSSFYGQTKDIARITSVTNINHGDSLTVQYSNESNSSLEIGLFLVDGLTSIRNYIVCSGSSYTFNFNDEELDSIYKLYGNNNQITLRVCIRTAGSFIDYAEFSIILTGNQKTAHLKTNEWNRAKIWVKKNKVWKRAVIWTCEQTGWKRGI